MKTFFAVALLLAVTGSAFGRAFTKCELAVELSRQGFQKANLPDWICLIQSESSFQTGVKGGPNSNGSFDWGLFQINDNYWCLVGQVGNDCNIDCNDLIDDDITDDSVCAKKIFGRHGYSAWHGWTKKCQGELPSIDECF